MPISHILLALSVVVIWGLNFIFVRMGLDELAPLLLCALRFLLASVPAVFFIKPPAVPFHLIVIYGLTMFALQFALLFVAMNVGMTPGMASLLMQVQVFFSMLFAFIAFGERVSPGQITGAFISFLGIALVAFHFDADVTLAGFLLVMACAVAWGIGNLIAKKINSTNFIAVIVWSSFISCWPMFILALIFEGPSSFSHAYQHLSGKGIFALLYIVFGSTWLGYGIWNWLIARYPVGVVVPFTLLVPLVGILSSVVVFHEPLQLWKLAAGLLIISGLGINILSTRLMQLKVRAEAT